MSALRFLGPLRTSAACLKVLSRPSSGSASASASVGLKKTCLYDLHVERGGKMVDFAGYSMPVQYEGEGIAASHVHTRTHCSIFDVSHMLQTHVYGKDRIKFMESLSVADVEGLSEDQGTLSVFTNAQGGIIDDLIITKTSGGFLYVVTNAGCREKDIPLMEEKAQEMKCQGLDVQLELHNDRGLIAVQGPESARVLQPLAPKLDVSKLYFMNTTIATVAGVEGCRVTRCGYTGEDGFEISIPEAQTSSVVQTLLESSNGQVHLAGLGSRDSLRLEAGLCLYGNDIDEETTPIEGGLAWTIGKRRRASADFPGADVILRQLKEKPSRRRVGLVSTGPSARAHTEIEDPETGLVVGHVTSGCPAPSCGGNVAMGHVKAAKAKNGTKLQLVIRKKKVEATVAKMPFVPAKYYMV